MQSTWKKIVVPTSITNLNNLNVTGYDVAAVVSRIDGTGRVGYYNGLFEMEQKKTKSKKLKKNVKRQE